VEVGAITADPIVVGWVEKLEPSTTFYSYLMNNYWETNYRAAQEGPVVFHYSMRPHTGFDPVRAQRFGVERCQPLLVLPAKEGADLPPPLFVVRPESVMITSFKPCEGGAGRIVRLYNTADRAVDASLDWLKRPALKVWMSSPAGEKGEPVEGTLHLPPYGIATVRCE
jgi:alpha-mannosidase